MADPEYAASDEAGQEAWLRQTLDSLDGDIIVGENGPELDAFMALYRELPEKPMTDVLGGDITIDFGSDGEAMRLRPLAAYGGNVVVRDLSTPRATQGRPKHYFLRGSMVFADNSVEKYGAASILQTALYLVGQGQSFSGKIGPEGPPVAYNPYTFCRDGRLVYAPALTAEDLRDKTFVTRAATSSILGMCIVVQPVPNQPLTLFVESNYKLSPPMAQVTHRVGSDYRNLLSYVPGDPDRLHG